MPTIVMKESPESDYYVGWSSVVEAPVFAGTRADVLKRLRSQSDPWLSESAPHHPARRMERADATGTTAMWVTGADLRDSDGNPYPEEGSWEDDSFIYMQRGLLSRPNVFALARRLEATPDADVADLLAPFDDEDGVRSA